MEVRQIDPAKLEIDPLNERNENVGPHKDNESLEKSVEKQGLIQPPIVRPGNGSYKVVVGQRRTLAAQSVGLNEIPVVIVDWDDAEALEASITENVDAFWKAVSRVDRSKAIRELMDMNGWSIGNVAEELGVSQRRVRDWLEHTRNEWNESVVGVDSTDGSNEQTNTEVESHSSNSAQVSKKELDQIPGTDLSTIRGGTESADEQRKVVREVVDKDLSQNQIREARKKAEHSDRSMQENVEEVQQETEEREAQGRIKVQTRVTFTGEYAEGLQKAARDYGTSEEDIVREAIKDYLTKEDYI